MTSTTLDRYDTELRNEALEDAVSALEDRWQHAGTFRHADGSVTVVEVEEYVEPFMSPREDDGNVARLVNEHRDYVDLDEPDAGIAEARERWGGGYRVGQSIVGETIMVRRYLAMFRPDIAHYEDRWEVTGNSQSDWQYGWGYVTTEDAASIALVADPKYTHDYNRAHPQSRRFRQVAAEAFDAELKVYGQYFAGEVYYATHLTHGEPVVEYGEQGAYVAGWTVDDSESCGGFLGYDSLEDIAREMSSSEVLD